jgi:hypothetical protein
MTYRECILGGMKGYFVASERYALIGIYENLQVTVGFNIQL